MQQEPEVPVSGCPATGRGRSTLSRGYPFAFVTVPFSIVILRIFTEHLPCAGTTVCVLGIGLILNSPFLGVGVWWEDVFTYLKAE